jgi:predicted Zn-dependent protease
MKAMLILILAVILFCAPAEMKAGKDVILQAMTDEMNRSMKSLQIENMDKPYYLEYTVTDSRLVSVKAAFGAITHSGESHNRSLRVDLRCGDYQLDNTGFMNRRSMFSRGRGFSGGIVKEDDYDAIRHDIWLQTDKAYKAVLEQLAAKKGFIKNQTEPTEIPDFSKEKSLQAVMPTLTMNVDRGKWETAVKNLSSIFRKYPALNHSAVELRFKLVHKYYVNSEGTVLRQPRVLAYLVAFASTQAPDGMKLKHFVPFYAPAIDGLPDEKTMATGIAAMAKELTALSKAPVLEKYIGPVLFTGQASAELFAQVFAPHLSGERPPLVDDPRMARMLPTNQLAQRLNRKVLPREIAVSDDPTTGNFKNQPLVGTYKADDQGVPAVPVKLVEEGVLKTLLMSRRPREEIANSNGHARASGRSKPGAAIGNLFITAEKGKSYDKLKKELLEFCEDQQLEFGLIVKTVDNPTITGVESSALSFLMQSGGGQGKLTAPVMLYRVYVKDDKEELVRGITFAEMTVKSLKDIEAVGNDYYVHHKLLTGAGGGISLFGGRGGGGAGIPGSIVAPSVLFEELEFKKDPANKKNPPLLAHPFHR